MDNNNNNQIFDEEGWPNDVYGFLRGTRPRGLNLWVTFLLEDKVRVSNVNDVKQGKFLHIGKKERIMRDREQKRMNEEEDEGRNKEEEGLSDEDYYNPYIQLYADSCDWGYGDGMPEAWRQ